MYCCFKKPASVGAGGKMTPPPRAESDPLRAGGGGVRGGAESRRRRRRGGGWRVVGVERWAELRRQHFVGGKSIKRLARETGLSRNTVRAALRSKEPPGYRRAPAGSVL